MNQVENNYTNTLNNKLSIKIIKSATYGFIIGVFVIVLWYLWAMFIYRWSPDRLSNIIIKKYQTLNQDKISANTYFKCVNIVVSDDKSTASCDMQLKNTITQNVLSSEHLVIKLATDESSCSELSIDVSCVLV